MKFEYKHFYGDKSRWFIGRVVNNRDPDMFGRVQIRIQGIHSPFINDIPEVGLPWAYTVLPSTEGGTSGIGRISQILPGALVFGFFLDGDTSQLPLVLGTINQFEKPTSRQRKTADLEGDTEFYDNFGEDGVYTDPAARNIGSTGGGSTGGGGGVSSRSASSNASITEKRFIAMKFFVDNGYTPKAAAGIVGNLEAESNFNTEIVSQFANESSQGIAQWNPDAGRLQKLKRFANRINQSWTSYDTQLKFIIHELRGVEKDNDGGSDFANVETLLKNSDRFNGGTTKKNSTWVFCRYYEVPADAAGKLPQREVYAKAAYDQFIAAKKVSKAPPPLRSVYTTGAQ